MSLGYILFHSIYVPVLQVLDVEVQLLDEFLGQYPNYFTGVSTCPLVAFRRYQLARGQHYSYSGAGSTGAGALVARNYSFPTDPACTTPQPPAQQPCPAMVCFSMLLFVLVAMVLVLSVDVVAGVGAVGCHGVGVGVEYGPRSCICQTRDSGLKLMKLANLPIAS